MSEPEKYCIVGAGPAGLAVARAFADAEIPFDVLERHSDVGGIWDLARGTTPMYESAHFISSRTLSGFSGFPMPAHYPDYPGWRLVLGYIRDFTAAHDLRRHVRVDTAVERVRPRSDTWEVRIQGGEVLRYRGVVLAVGHQWDPIAPQYAGRFDGEAFHSLHYRSPKQLEGKRVLVVGAGNSGCDIACDAAASAARAVISVRRGYHVIPKHIFGKPADAVLRGGPALPAWIGQPLLSALLRILVGDLRRYGLPRPDHKVLESHPIVNSQLLHYIAHGDLVPKPDVAELTRNAVRFTDGTEEPIDLIIFATGYRPTIPCLDTNGDGRLRTGDPGALLGNLFSRAHPSLFVAGHFETDGGAYPIVSRQAALIAALIRRRHDHPGSTSWLDRMRAESHPDLSGGVRHIASPRHAVYVQYEAYARFLEKLRRRIA